MRRHASFVVGLVLMGPVWGIVTTAVGDGPAADPTPVSAAELEGILADPGLTVERRVELLRGLGNRSLDAEALDVAKSALRTCHPPVIQALSELLVNVGKRREAHAVLTDAALHPAPPYDRWVGAVGAFESAIWPILGIIFLPWTTLMYVLLAPGGVTGLDWLWIILSVVADVAMYAGGGYGNRDRIPA